MRISTNHSYLFLLTFIPALAMCSSDDVGVSDDAGDGSQDADTALDANGGGDGCEAPEFSCGSGCCLISDNEIVSGSDLRLLAFSYSPDETGTLLFGDNATVRTWSGSNNAWTMEDQLGADSLLDGRISNLFSETGGDLSIALYKNVIEAGELSLATRTNGTWDFDIVSPHNSSNLSDYLRADPLLRRNDSGWSVWARGTRLFNGTIVVDQWTKNSSAWEKRERFSGGSASSGIINDGLGVADVGDTEVVVWIQGTQFPQASDTGQLDFQTKSLNFIHSPNLDAPVLLYSASGQNSGGLSVFARKHPLGLNTSEEVSPEGFSIEDRTPINAIADSDGNIHVCYSSVVFDNAGTTRPLQYIVQSETTWTAQTLAENTRGSCRLGARADGGVDVFYVEKLGTEMTLHHTTIEKSQ